MALSGVYICNKCAETKPPGERFKVPADRFGVEIMKAHLWEEHKINVDHRKAQEPEIGSYLDF